MSVSDGNPVNAAITNAAYISRKVNSDTIGVVTLDNITDPNSGNTINNTQRYINEIADSDGTNGEGDAARKQYSSTNFVANGDDRKVAIGKLDAQAQTQKTNFDTHVADSSVHGVTGNVVGTTDTQNLSNKTFIDSTTFSDTTSSTNKDTGALIVEGGVGIEENLNVGGNATITGNLTVNGTTTSVQTTNTEIADANIVLNDGGNDASSEGAGITVERTSTDGSIVYEDALTSKFKVGALGSEVEIADVSSSQVITNKDIDGTTASNTNRITIPKNTTTNLNALTRKEGTVVYDTTVAKLKFDDGSSLQEIGSGSGGAAGINYIENPDAETDTTGFATYQDAAGVKPVDATGGTANITFSRTTVSSEILRDTASFEIAKDAVNRQGEGVSYDFTCDEADTTNLLKISFDYTTSANYVDGDIRVYLVDVTNTNPIEPVPVELLAGTNGRFISYVQTSTATSYRLAFHIASTNASAYDVFLDNIQVGPATRSFGPVVSDWEDSTITSSWTTNTTIESWEKRIGDTAYFKVKLSLSGAPNATTLTLDIPYTIDTTKFAADTSDLTLGLVSYFDSSASNTEDDGGQVNYVDTNTVRPLLNNSIYDQTTPITWGASDEIFLEFSVPIQGWSSSQQISDDAETRVVAFSGQGAGGQSVVSGNTVLFSGTIYKDTHGAYNSGTGEYTVTSSGFYRVMATSDTQNVSATAGQYFAIDIQQTGSVSRTVFGQRDIAYTSSTRGFNADLSTGFYCEKGDILKVVFNETIGTVNTSSTGSTLYIAKDSGPSQIAANELVSCSYTTNAGQTVTSGNTVLYEDKEEDTHDAYNPSTGEFTCPAAGKYLVLGKATTAATAGLLNRWQIDADQTGSVTRSKTLQAAPLEENASLATRSCGGSALFICQKGDILKISFSNDSGYNSKTLTTNANENYLAITRQGF